MCEDPDNYDSKIVKLLTYLITNKYDLEERKRILKEDYGITMEEIYEGVNDMSSLSEAVFQEGRLEGRLEGKLEGRLEGKLEIAKSMLIKNLPIEIILDCTGLSEEEIEKLR